MQTVFYSWQSDLPNSTNRGFIQDCLEKAIKELRAEGAIHIDPSPDRDTQGVPGSPDISETIFDKIDSCAAFVCDMSLINGWRNNEKAGCDCTRLIPNPNVLCEWGRATKSAGFERVISVFNEATGTVEDLPFDLRKRRVLTYRLQGADDKADQRKLLVGKLKHALQGILALPRTALEFEFGDSQNEIALGREIEVTANGMAILPEEQIPDYDPDSRNISSAIAALRDRTPNRHYFREKAYYLAVKRLTRPIAFAIRNTGDRLLRNVRLEILIPFTLEEGLFISDVDQLPSLPERTHNRFQGISNSLLSGIRRNVKNPGDLNVKRFSDRYKIEATFGDLQPKASCFSEEVQVGSMTSRTLTLEALLFADELQSPEPKTLSIKFETEMSQMTITDLEDDLAEEIEGSG